MSGHTPGPWTVDRGDIRGPLGEVIALVCFPERTVSAANARAMAASPDLLSALRPIAAAYPDDPGTSDLDNEQPVTITLGDVRRAWAAISKADRRL